MERVSFVLRMYKNTFDGMVRFERRRETLFFKNTGRFLRETFYVRQNYKSFVLIVRRMFVGLRLIFLVGDFLNRPLWIAALTEGSFNVVRFLLTVGFFRNNGVFSIHEGLDYAKLMLQRVVRVEL